MSNFFDFNTQEFLEFAINSYKLDRNYDKNLDIVCNIKISKEERIGDVEKTIKLKINKRKRKLQIKIPKGIKNGQSILFVGQGRKRNNMYGNLIMKFNFK